MSFFSIKHYSFTFLLCFFSIFYSHQLYAETERAKRPFERVRELKAGLNVPIPARPKWNHYVEPREGTYGLIISTPEKFYPQVSIEIVLNHRINIKTEELEEVALSTLNAVRVKSNFNESIKKSNLELVTYGEIIAYEDTFQLESNNKGFSIRSIMGLMSSGHPITIFIATPKGQINHIKDITNKIISNLKELPVEIK